MFKITYILLLSFTLGLFSINPVLATDDFVFTINSLSEFKAGQYPFVSGKAFTLDNNPVSDVQVQVNFPSEKISTTTNSTGQFSVISTNPAEIGDHTIIVYAKKDNRYTDAQITYLVIENKPTTIQETQKQVAKTPKENNGKIELDPFSKMLQELEEQKTEEFKREISIKEKQQIDVQRQLAQEQLQKDLKDNEKRNESHSPRNVFYKFIQEVDSSVRGIFWQQFLFTEKITQQAGEARDSALKEGKSSIEAMKIFQKEASVTQKQVMEFNKNLSIKYGNATSAIQEQFDEKGKLPRVE